MSDSAAATAAPRSVTLGGETFEVRGLTLAAVGRVQAWIKGLPRPRHVARVREDCQGLPADATAGLLADAAEADRKWPPTFPFDPEASELLLTSPEGMAVLLAAVLSRDDPAVTTQRAGELVARATFPEMAAFMRAISPGGEEPDLAVPEADARLVVLSPAACRAYADAILRAAGCGPEAAAVALESVDPAAFGSVLRLAVEPEGVAAPKGHLPPPPPTGTATA